MMDIYMISCYLFVDVIEQKCANCGVTAEECGQRDLKRCAQCHVVSYCGKECQTKHWKQGGHKRDCCCKCSTNAKSVIATFIGILMLMQFCFAL